jgi:hypothetical protein
MSTKKFIDLDLVLIYLNKKEIFQPELSLDITWKSQSDYYVIFRTYLRKRLYDFLNARIIIMLRGSTDCTFIFRQFSRSIYDLYHSYAPLLFICPDNLRRIDCNDKFDPYTTLMYTLD